MSKSLDFMIVAYNCESCEDYVLVHLAEYEVEYHVHSDNGIYLDVKCPACGRSTSVTLKEKEAE